jgi:hypothetical protein
VIGIHLSDHSSPDHPMSCCCLSQFGGRGSSTPAPHTSNITFRSRG